MPPQLQEGGFSVLSLRLLQGFPRGQEHIYGKTIPAPMTSTDVPIRVKRGTQGPARPVSLAPRELADLLADIALVEDGAGQPAHNTLYVACKGPSNLLRLRVLHASTAIQNGYSFSGIGNRILIRPLIVLSALLAALSVLQPPFM